MANGKTYLVATLHPWNVEQFEHYGSTLGGEWHLITSREELTAERVQHLNPRYIFLPHWSWMVPAEIYGRWECVAFHETDLPFGRGGSPVQNLIARGHSETMVTAFRVTDGLDAGDIYAKRPLSLAGAAEEIFGRAARVIAAMIAEIAAGEPTPVPQVGEPVTFKRRKPEQSEITADFADLDAIYDHIRMLDAPGYPQAFIRLGPYVLRFQRALRRTGAVEADVTISREDGE